MHRTRGTSIALLCLALAGCAASLTGLPNPPSGTYRVDTDVTFRLLRRSFLLHVPPGYRAGIPMPLVVVLHGAFSTGREIEADTGFSGLADAEGFLVAYPEGIGLFGLLQHWNAGHCCGKAEKDGIDDVGYVAAVISAVRAGFTVDPGRVYMAGMSNGGMLAYRFASERPGALAAFAVVSGAIDSSVTDGKERRWRLPTPGEALPLLVIHGLADDSIPAEGGMSRDGRGRSWASVDNAVDLWIAAGGVVECRLIEGWGHVWPGPRHTLRPGVDESLRGFDAARLIWEFFRRFRRAAGDGG